MQGQCMTILQLTHMHKCPCPSDDNHSFHEQSIIYHLFHCAWTIVLYKNDQSPLSMFSDFHVLMIKSRPSCMKNEFLSLWVMKKISFQHLSCISISIYQHNTLRTSYDPFQQSFQNWTESIDSLSWIENQLLAWLDLYKKLVCSLTWSKLVNQSN